MGSKLLVSPAETRFHSCNDVINNLIGNFLRVQIERILQELGQEGDTGKGRQH